MKKVIALALAMMLSLSMVAMAVENLVVTPGETGAACTALDLTLNDRLYPGEKYHLALSDDTITNDTGSLKNYSVAASWKEGAALVKSTSIVKCGDTYHICIELKENFTIPDKDGELKVVLGTLTLTAKNDVKDSGFAGDPIKRNTKFIIELNTKGIGSMHDWDGDNHDVLLVANEQVEISGGDTKSNATEYEVEDNTIYKATSSGWVEFAGYGDRTASFKVFMNEDKRIFAYFNEKHIEAVEDKFYDLDADLEFINFVAKPNLGKQADVALIGAWSAQYRLYEYNNGKLSQVKDAKWNADDGQFEFKTSQLTSYVISDKELKAGSLASSEPAETTDDNTTVKNPDTGANDVVGVAVALAVVSLVAAGAVSLKK